MRISDWSSDVCSSDLAPAAASGALLSGLAMGAFWGLTPLYAVRLGLQVDDVARLMAATIVGGAVLQWPIGRLSDRGERRTGLAVLGVEAAGLGGARARGGVVAGTVGVTTGTGAGSGKV